MFEVAALIKADIPAEKLTELMEINAQSAYYNLLFSNEDILKLVSARSVYLRYADRIEFGFDTLESIINAFYKSPYINQFEYTDIINELQFIFYVLKNEVSEALTDEELISLMAELFDGPYAGSLELLKGLGAEYIKELAKQKNKEENGWYEVKKEISSEALGSGIIPAYSDIEAPELLYSLRVILEELLLKYTNGRSLSIKAETAQSIVGTILYAARIAGENGTDAVRLKAAYYKGIEIIGGILKQSKRLYAKAKETRLHIDLASYNETLDSINGFFENYDIEFAAAEVPAQMRYFPVFCDRRLEGVEFIKSWLLCFIIENEICGLFDKGDIELLLAALEERDEKGRALIDVNVFELVLTNSLYAIIAGKQPNALTLTPKDAPAIKRRMKSVSAIDEAVCSFLKYFKINTETDKAEYVNKYILNKLKPLIDKEKNNPELIAVFAEEKPLSFLYPNEKMPDERFRELVYRLHDESDFGEKVRIIRENVSSITDLVDLLNDSIFSGGEYKSFFKELSEDETQILWEAVRHALRGGGGSYIIAMDSVTIETEWVKSLFEYKEGV